VDVIDQRRSYCDVRIWSTIVVSLIELVKKCFHGHDFESREAVAIMDTHFWRAVKQAVPDIADGDD